jgi:hypothetical protein
VTPYDAVVTNFLAAYPKTREREGGRTERVHVGEGDRPLVAQAMTADPGYPWLDAARWYAKSTTRPKNLREWLLNPTAREIVLKATKSAQGRDSPGPDTEIPPPFTGNPELAAVAAAARAQLNGHRRAREHVEQS